MLRKKNDAGIEVGALEIKVLIDGSRTQGRVKDLKQLSGLLPYIYKPSGQLDSSSPRVVRALQNLYERR